MKKLKAIYVRVSTDIQVEGYSIDAQIELIKAYLKSKEWNDYKIYTDPGFSGKDLNRPKIKELIKDIKNGFIDCVLVYKLDRISRSQKDTLYLIEEVFNKYNCGFISIRESFDTTTPFGKAMIGILSVFAQLERETILERTRLGLRKRAEEGLWRGGGKLPFAYDYNKDSGLLIINPERQIIFNMMKTLRIQGYSYHKLQELTGIDESMIQSILNCKINLGLITYKGEIFNGKHQAIITNEEYKQLKAVEKNRSRNKGSKHYLLSGKIYCGKCGAKYRYQKWGKRTVCYCYSKQRSKPKLIKDPNCNNVRIDSYKIENNFLDSLFKFSIDKNRFKDIFDLPYVNNKNKLKERLNKISKQLDNLLDFISNNVAIEETKEKINKLLIEKEQVKKSITKIKSNSQVNNKLNFINSLKDIWDKMLFEEKRSIIECLVDKIIITDNNLKIKWKMNLN